jgi:hypothetical protein
MYETSFFGSNSLPMISFLFSTLLEMNVPWCIAGRNELPHSGGPTVVGVSGQRTTKPGRFLFSVPRP